MRAVCVEMGSIPLALRRKWWVMRSGIAASPASVEDHSATLEELRIHESRRVGGDVGGNCTAVRSAWDYIVMYPWTTVVTPSYPYYIYDYRDVVDVFGFFFTYNVNSPFFIFML